MKKVIFLLINIISIVDLFCLFKAFDYAEKNVGISNRDNMVAMLFWPLLCFIIVFIVIIINFLLGIAGVIYLRNNHIVFKDFIYRNSDKLVLKILKVMGYFYISFCLLFFIKEFTNSNYLNYYGLLFFILSIVNTVFYTIWIVAVVKGIYYNSIHKNLD